MKAEEKQVIYDLLRKASDNYYGYSSPEFTAKLTFQDDSEKITEKLPEFPAPAQPEPVEKKETASPAISAAPTESSTPTAPEASNLSVSSLQEKISLCARCRLHENPEKNPPETGIQNPLVLVLTDARLGSEESELLDKMLSCIDLSKYTNTYIASAVKCRTIRGRNPYPDEMESCRAFLDAQLHLLKPKIILCLGKHCFQSLTGTTGNLDSFRGKMFEYNNIPVMVTHHPAECLKNPEVKRPCWEDLKLFKIKLEGLKN